jgi:peptidoglycan/xylan/chitin deacetylase (PgdA/CDA1 family)
MRSSGLRVLTYHRVLEPPDVATTDPSLISATPAVFDRQMGYLAAHYRAVSAEEVLEAARTGRSLPERAVMVTFDDGCRDFGEIAWPILRRHGIPATVFVSTAFPDHPEREFWWDRIYRAAGSSARAALELSPLGVLPLDTPQRRRASVRALQNHLKAIPHAEAMRLAEWIIRELGGVEALPGEVLSWSALRGLVREGVTLCAHTRTHPALDQLTLDEARAEIRGSHEDLLREIGSSPPLFAYTFGAHSDGVMEVLREEGFELAVTCLDGHNEMPFRDPLRLRRTHITRRTTPFIFSLRLLKVFSYVDRWRHRHRSTDLSTGQERWRGAAAV